MMRACLSSLALLASSCALLLTGSSGTALAGSSGAGSPPAWFEDGALSRTWTVGLSPAPGDLALAEIGFPRARGKRLSAGSLHVSVNGPFGADYLVLAAASSSLAGREARALVLLVNRPSPLEDPVTVRLRESARRSLGKPVLRRLSDPLSHPPTPAPALCRLALHGAALNAAGLHVLHVRGQAIAGFAAPAALAQAYDLACGLPHSSAFAQAIGAVPGSVCPEPAKTEGTLCCPANAICAQPPTAPSPPQPEPPACTPCQQRPGYACPLVARESICVDQIRRATTSAVAGAH
jgi:hypothetical protein